MSCVLVIEDDATLRRVLNDNLSYDGHRVVTAADGEAGLSAALDETPDLILLDIMLPKINGYEICRRLRDAKLNMPIIMLTAKGEESDLVLGLNLGADDYVTKPFSIRELMARVSAFLRRSKAEQPVHYAFGGFVLNADARTLSRDGSDVELTTREYDLLHLLVSKAGKALTRDTILNAVWGYSNYVTPRTVDRFVTTLRKKIEPDPASPTYIHTLRGVGYRFAETNREG